MIKGKDFSKMSPVTKNNTALFLHTGGSTSKVTSADVSVSLTVVCLFGSCFPLLNFFGVNTIFCLFIQNATPQSTRGVSKKSLASAPARRPTVGTLWWAKLMLNISAKTSTKFWGIDLFFVLFGWLCHNFMFVCYSILWLLTDLNL